MGGNHDAPTAVDKEQEHRFVLFEGGPDESELVYRLNGKRLVLIHTGVPEHLQGHGLGGQLMRAALRRAADDGLTVVPLCPYAVDWLRQHPDAAEGVEIAWPENRAPTNSTGNGPANA